MQKIFIAILLIIVLVVVFVLRNIQPVDIDFWLWTVNGNLSLVIVIAITSGALVSFLLSLPYQRKKQKEIKAKNETIKSLEDEIGRLHSESEAPIDDNQNMNDNMYP